MLDEKGKVARIIEKYVTLLNKGNYKEAFKLLTYVHIPGKRNEKMFELAQTLMSKTYDDITYEVKDIKIYKNFASVPVDIILYNSKAKRKIKVSSQFLLYKPKKSIIWFIVAGDENSRKIFLEKFKKEINGKIKLIHDKTYVSKNGKWVEITKK
jgi:hypothetical protein